MNSKTNHPVAALFPDRKSADQAVADLGLSGFDIHDIKMVVHNEEETPQEEPDGGAAAPATAAGYNSFGGLEPVYLNTFSGTPATLSAFHLSDDDFHFFSSRFEESRTLVIVQAGERAGLARTVLERNGGETGAAAAD